MWCKILPSICLLLPTLISFDEAFYKIKSPSPLPDLYEASIAQLSDGLNRGQFTSVDLVNAYFARIDEVNLQGATLRAVLELNPSALRQAAELDLERKLKGPRSALHGIPVLVKDNIATVASEGMNTTAGSYALLKSIVPDDAGVIKRLRAAGAIILGKANLSEWSNMREVPSSGWSGRGGQSSGAYYPNADPCGSSSGSGIAASIGLAAVTLGTETDGSITCPASMNNVVGVKPTVGLTSRAGVIPITEQQDTVGPLVRSVSDAAVVLSIIAGPDPNDNFTLGQPTPVPDFTKALKKDALRGARIGIPRRVFLDNTITEADPSVDVLFEQAIETIKELGATIIDPADIPSGEEIVLGNYSSLVARVDFKIHINAWFTSLKSNPTGIQTLADLIAFNDANPTLEEPTNYTDQTSFIASEKTNGRTAEYFQSLARNKEVGATRGIDAALKNHNVDALIMPVLVFNYGTRPSAFAGYPIVTVPLGFYPENVTIRPSGPVNVYPAPGLPIGLSFLGTAYSEFDLIGFAYAYEQKTQTRLGRLAFPAAMPKTQLIDVIGK